MQKKKEKKGNQDSTPCSLALTQLCRIEDGLLVSMAGVKTMGVFVEGRKGGSRRAFLWKATDDDAL